MRTLDRDIEGTVERVTVDVVQEDGVVALCQQGDGSCNQDRHVSANGVIYGADEYLRFASAGLSQEYAKFLPSGSVLSQVSVNKYVTKKVRKYSFQNTTSL